MNFSVRHVLIGLGIAFTAYLAGRGLWWETAPPARPVVVAATLMLYLITTWLCLFWEQRAPTNAPTNRPAGASDTATGASERATAAAGEASPNVSSRGIVPLPIPAGVLAVAVAVLVPSTIAIAAGEASRSAPFATWYIGGIGALMTIVMVRRRPWFAWTGTAVLAVGSMVWLGFVPALALGLVGSIVWVGATQLLLLSLDRAARDTTRLEQLQRAASAWQAAQSGRERERRVQVQRALAIAGPILARTIRTNGFLDDVERREARLAEGQLRDELRAPRLLDDDVRAALDAARRRGATVTVLDEGGLERVDDGDLAEIRTELARTIEGANSDRLYIRTSPDDRVAVTVVGRSGASTVVSDEDSVDLWAEIAHRAAE